MSIWVCWELRWVWVTFQSYTVGSILTMDLFPNFIKLYTFINLNLVILKSWQTPHKFCIFYRCFWCELWQFVHDHASRPASFGQFVVHKRIWNTSYFQILKRYESILDENINSHKFNYVKTFKVCKKKKKQVEECHV